MTRYPTIAAEKKPIMSGNRSICSKLPILIILLKLAPKRIGKAIKKENLAASRCFMPMRSATEIVMPDREIPGNKAKAWAIPIQKAINSVNCLMGPFRAK